jgi:hypothetical protein
MAKRNHNPLKKGEAYSTKYAGYIQKENGVLKKQRVYFDKKSGKMKSGNSYFVETKCAVCGSDTLQDLSNQKRSKSKSACCSRECQNKIRERQDGFKKYKRGTIDSHVMVRARLHKNADGMGYVPEHRLIIEEQIGRHLDKKEIVHHINLVKSDNRIENLVLFKCSRDHFLSHGSLNKCVKQLIDVGVLYFDRSNNTYQVVK